MLNACSVFLSATSNHTVEIFHLACEQILTSVQLTTEGALKTLLVQIHQEVVRVNVMRATLEME